MTDGFQFYYKSLFFQAFIQIYTLIMSIKCIERVIIHRALVASQGFSHTFGVKSTEDGGVLLETFNNGTSIPM